MTGAVLEGRDLARFYTVNRGLFKADATVKALNGVSFSLHSGKTLAVVGESGCGKSTLARLVTMIENPTSGQLLIDGKPAQVGDRSLRSQVQIVFQNPYGSLNPRQKVGSILEEPLKINTNLDAAARRRKVEEMMARVGLRPEHYGRYPHMFSGGQRQRIAIARALMLRPKVLVLDEPVSALDLSIQAQVLNLLMDLQKEMGLAYLFISHGLSVVHHIADEVMVMYLGRPVETGPAAEVFARPRHPYTAALLSATPIADPDREKTRIRLQGELPSPLKPPSGCHFNPRCWKAQDHCRQVSPELTGEGTHQYACHFPLD
ncbi:ABC transporter ATP-binding protein [Rhizobium ruizarguesonis]|jgi:dipeptide transport system ATP-binding protein|uniref:ABC transporter ATP-binding protein n=1 Tax=Rhizobium ruizarguesonis TaxID=2081791 RepID=A0AAE4YKS7_9HYPH|nr:peptide ABC transporter ATP-binding protein [Rhizobium ruizarguesonis]MBY5806045.1 ABC transporter ATP-binding protein [Rhizobium leguminosarum]NKJ77301.1 dipeptide ABC transporter ATP-binding protein [Rhizobium leguminosarum bv. viciae]QIO44899.1 ABC transporter ATP-binding protein [Rhizobium leguminosarum bv. trifolii]QJS26202.1 ABC transporter ATP-binding protein [Rhizobium leguminosarum bv. trifolii TA1]MBC2802329.1 ABC transporter ATP-binding protein [Rhizobium ruizarguesonis]